MEEGDRTEIEEQPDEMELHKCNACGEFFNEDMFVKRTDICPSCGSEDIEVLILKRATDEEMDEIKKEQSGWADEMRNLIGKYGWDEGMNIFEEQRGITYSINECNMSKEELRKTNQDLNKKVKELEEECQEGYLFGVEIDGEKN